ncbi:MAG: 50S ribosomal protein L18 [Candidatus Dasytiphilus stammeri]
MEKKYARVRRGKRTRYKLKILNTLRLVIYRTSRHIYAQIIETKKARVLVTASTLERDINHDIKYTGNQIAASIIGRIIAERALKKGIKNVSFDRSGFLYHGRIKVLAESARKAGLIF